LAKRKTSNTDKTQATGKTTTRKRAAKPKTSNNGRAAEDSTKTAPESGDDAVELERRSKGDRRQTPDRRKKDVPVAVERRKVERRAKVNRRRQIDPTTCERDYSPEEIEFMNAMDDYKRASGRMFPTCSEVLEVIRKLGYEKRVPEEAVEPGGQQTEPTAVPAAAE
jgi:hypothetical protein